MADTLPFPAPRDALDQACDRVFENMLRDPRYMTRFLLQTLGGIRRRRNEDGFDRALEANITKDPVQIAKYLVRLLEEQAAAELH